MKLTATVVAFLILGAVVVAFAQEKRAVSARDCVTVRSIWFDGSTYRSTIKISPDGTRVLYPVTSPDLHANENVVELYVRNVPAGSNRSEKPVFAGDISAIRWRSDSRHITYLIRENGRRVIGELDSVTGEHHVLFRAASDIPEYSIDERGSTLVYGADVPDEAKQAFNQKDIARGYRIPFQTSVDAPWPKRRFFVTRRTRNSWTASMPIVIRSPLSQQELTALSHGGGNSADLMPALSPDGRKLLLRYYDMSEEMPDEWRQSEYMQHRNTTAGVFQTFHPLVLYDPETGTTSLPLKTPWVLSAPLWSSDSKSFVVVAEPPINSRLEQENLRNGLVGRSAGHHLFWVEPATDTVEDIAGNLAFAAAGPLFWDTNGDLLVQVASMDTITRYSRIDGKWRENGSFRIPVRVDIQVATDGKYVIGDFNDTTTPPQLFIYRPGDSDVRVFARLNPETNGLTLAQPREVHWKTSTGFNASGLLLLPPDYVRGRKYPLVIQTKPFTESFVCGFGNFPSFAPQPLASAGIAYLGSITTNGSTQRERDYYPKGYPGGIAEAAFAMDWWDTAVKALDEEGLVDSSRVGIIGFSRTGWYTEFILAHSAIHYHAATVADNVHFSLGEYWLRHDVDTIKSFEVTYGGPPYGSTLKNWLAGSVSFNLDKIHTPLLMEEMGDGKYYDSTDSPPLSLAVNFEVFTGLNRLNRPVEMYYYPNDGHTPEHPQARLATLQRNVDWYRFWLQDYERPDPEDPQQYVRWRKLRELQQEDERKAALTAANDSSGQHQPKQ